MRAGIVRFIGLALAAHAAGGCVAPLQEERLYGASRPRDDGAPDVVPQRQPGAVELDATMHGAELDVAVAATTACRNVDVTPRVQDVSVRRSFADGSQEVNGALALLAGVGVGALQYSADQIDCPSGSACWSAMITSEYAMLAAAAVPVAFLIYNAFRVRDAHEIAAAAPEIREGPWSTCSREPLAGEPVYVRIPHTELTRITDASGHAAFDLTHDLGDDAAAVPPVRPVRPVRIVVRHSGSPNVVIDWSPPGSPVDSAAAPAAAPAADSGAPPGADPGADRAP